MRNTIEEEDATVVAADAEDLAPDLANAARVATVSALGAVEERTVERDGSIDGDWMVVSRVYGSRLRDTLTSGAFLQTCK